MSATARQVLTRAARQARESTPAAGAASRVALITRGLSALVGLSEIIGDHVPDELADASSDYEALLVALEQPEILDVIRRKDPLARARLRGLQTSRALLDAEGGVVTAGDVAATLEISRQAVNKRRQAGSLLAVSLGRRGYLYPAWQFGVGGVLPGFTDVLHDLDGHDAWMRLAFMLNPNSWLDGRTPLAELRRGNVEAVRRAAQVHGEQGPA